MSASSAMKIVQATTLLLGVVWLLAPGALAFAAGSDPSCPLPRGPDPKCARPPWFERLPHPYDGRYYIQCDINSEPICRRCPFGRLFNYYTKICDIPAIPFPPFSPYPVRPPFPPFHPYPVRPPFFPYPPFPGYYH